jgi:predicted nucleic acid-binding protein
VLVETWGLVLRRLGFEIAERLWEGLRRSGCRLEPVLTGDLEVAWAIGERFPDQRFPIVDRTSFAVMQRLGVLRAATFDDHFAIIRFGRSLDRAFEIVR